MTTIAKWCAAGLTACVWSLSFNALADDSAALKKKLASIRQFSAHFEQEVKWYCNAPIISAGKRSNPMTI